MICAVGTGGAFRTLSVRTGALVRGPPLLGDDARDDQGDAEGDTDDGHRDHVTDAEARPKDGESDTRLSEGSFVTASGHDLSFRLIENSLPFRICNFKEPI